MKTAHRYILEPYKGMNTRYRCPSCQHRNKTFSRYTDTETGEHLHPSVGRCNRESNCGYHYTPKQYFQDNHIPFEKNTVSRFHSLSVKKQETAPKPVSLPVRQAGFIPVEVFKASLNPTAFETNHFVGFLINLFGVKVASDLVSRYFIATSKHWNGATVFWQIDTQGKVRTGKIMLYSPTTGKRVKEPFNHISWVHKALKQPEFELKQCLFGEHLLIDNTKPVAIVESEKTAIIASVYLPQFIWLAFGGIGFNIDKCSILKGRNVTLFPDLSKPEVKPTAFEKWSNKAKELSPLASFMVSDLLERKATEAERKQGADLADYLVKYDYKAFALPEPEPTQPTPALPTGQAGVQPMVEVKPFEQPEPPKPESWSNEIADIENYFAGISIPTQPITLNKCSTITNCSLFLGSHFSTVKANNGKRTFLPFLGRLQELREQVYTYPKERDLPAERNPSNDYWRQINLLENLEGAVIAKDDIAVNKAIDSIYLFYGMDADLPTELMKIHCPTAYQLL